MSVHLTFRVEGMTCANCSGRVERAIKKVPGVTQVNVNLTTAKASITANKRNTSVRELFSEVEKAGYHPVAGQFKINIGGMTCINCTSKIERTLKKMDGVLEANVNLTTAQATLSYIPDLLKTESIAKAIQSLGYVPQTTVFPDGKIKDQESDNRDFEIQGLKQSALISTGFTIPLVGISMGRMIPGVGDWMLAHINETSWMVFELILAVPILLYAGKRFFVHGWAEFRNFSPGMNSLVVLGVSAAFIYSTLALTLPWIFPLGTAKTYFEAVGVIITLILFGRYLEAVARGRTSEAIRKLVNLQPANASVDREGQDQNIDVRDIVLNDLVTVRPGERVPIDGIIVSGESYIDQSMITGEPQPIKKGLGDEVVGGTINKAGAFQFSVTRLGSETTLNRIVQMVEDAQSSKPQIQRIADRIASVFVPSAIILSSFTFVLWLAFGPEPPLSYAFVTSVSVLLIACPCAMGLATPTAIMVGTGRGADLGILFRNGEALEVLSKVDTFALDKTGTLTLGRPILTDFFDHTGQDDVSEQTLTIIAAAEQQSEHPVAQAIIQAAHERNLNLPPVKNFSVKLGHGIEAKIKGKHVAVGGERLMQSLGIDVSPVRNKANTLASKAKTPIYAAIDGNFSALLAVSDPIKKDSREVVKKLKNLGFKIAMVTGDNQKTAESIASKVGIDDWVASALPETKVEKIKKLQSERRKVAIVGDGINDAPALVQADVGIAVANGTDIAIEAGDLVLMSEELNSIIDAFELAQKTIKTIKGNFFWAYSYNVALIPLAAGALFPIFGILLDPMLAAAAMSASSIFVVTNSLRIRSFQPSLRQKTI